MGTLFGTRGGVVVVEGGGFANTLTQYDSFSAGRLADVEGLPPFSFTLDSVKVTHDENGTLVQTVGGTATKVYAV